MNNNEIYNHFLQQGIPSPIAASAADIISAHTENMLASSGKSYQLHNGWLSQLLADFCNLYAISGDDALNELKAKLI